MTLKGVVTPRDECPEVFLYFSSFPRRRKSLALRNCVLKKILYCKKRWLQPATASAAAMLAWSWLSRKVGACVRKGWVQGGARAAFATPSWGPSLKNFS